MKIKIERFKQTKDCTFGKLYINNIFKCYTLEDIYREVKIYSETRIPEGNYNIKLRTVGNFHQKYLIRFGEDFHKGMLWIKNIPNYEGVLIHIGNSKKDTAGCILVGKNYEEKTSTISESTLAYKEIYSIICNSLLKNEKVDIDIIDLDR